MIEIRWSPRALVDVKRLYDFLYDKNPDAAKRAVSEIRKGVKQLLYFPEIGKPIENLLPKFRDLNIPFGARGYIIRYHYDRNEIIILTIRHYLEVYKD